MRCPSSESVSVLLSRCTQNPAKAPIRKKLTKYQKIKTIEFLISNANRKEGFHLTSSITSAVGRLWPAAISPEEYHFAHTKNAQIVTGIASSPEPPLVCSLDFASDFCGRQHDYLSIAEAVTKAPCQCLATCPAYAGSTGHQRQADAAALSFDDFGKPVTLGTHQAAMRRSFYSA